MERAEANLARWREEAERLERERRGLVWVLRVGIPAGIVVAAAHALIGAGVVAMSLVTYGLGMYMITVRRREFAQEVRAAEAACEAAREAAREVR
ncbi:MAG: hypothetical protein ACO31E_05535 [Phycisphaerales bacterium]